MRPSEDFHASLEAEQPESPKTIEKMEQGKYLISTGSGSHYVLEKNKNGGWTIGFEGKKCKVRGFANWPCAPDQLAYQAPEMKSGYQFSQDPQEDWFIIFETKSPESEGGIKVKKSSQILKIMKVND